MTDNLPQNSGNCQANNCTEHVEKRCMKHDLYCDKHEWQKHFSNAKYDGSHDLSPLHGKTLHIQEKDKFPNGDGYTLKTQHGWFVLFQQDPNSPNPQNIHQSNTYQIQTNDKTWKMKQTQTTKQ